MQFKIITNRKLPFFVAVGLMALLTSCGSFQYAGYNNDGIYSSDVPEPEKQVVATAPNESNYYKNYFAENAADVNAITEESEVFTDIDSYQGNYIEREQDTVEQRPAYGGWGQNNSNVTINVIDNGWMGFNDPWLWNGGFGFNNWGWGQPWGINRWGWNRGFGWGGGFGWNNVFFGNQNRYAFAGGRRGSLLNNNSINSIGRNNTLTTRRGNSALSRRNYSTSRLSNSRSTTRRNSSLSRTNSNSRTIRNTGTSRTNRTIRNSSSTRNSNSRVTRPTTSRSSSSTRSSTRSSRSSGSSTRSSGSSRSSSGSRSSGGSRRGRG